MDKILAKAQELAARKEQLDAERQVAKLDKEYNDIKLQLRAVLGDDALEIIDGGKPYFTDSRQTVYLQNGDWLFNTGGWYEKPTANVTHVAVERRGYTNDWQHFSDLATFGTAIKKNLEILQSQMKQKLYEEERLQAYENANPDWRAVSLFKRLVVDLDAYALDGRDHLVPGQRLLVALAGYLANREQIPDWEDPESDPDDSEEE